jgi:catechol 2,3-dioxygenase-like lactoylglutathione lyase family enzyme
MTMPAPNLFIVYVTDAQVSADFYGALFEMEPVFRSPRFIAFALGDGVQLALWSGASVALGPEIPRTSEVCLNLGGGPAAIDAVFEAWSTMGVTVVEGPHDDVFGRTFVVSDPDGNLIRVAPVD